MDCDVKQIRDFYKSPLGKFVYRTLNKAIDPYIQNTIGLDILGAGYTVHHLNSCKSDGVICCCFPENLGVISSMNDAKQNRSILVNFNYLPFSNQVFDMIFILHGLEYADDPERFLKELYRVLKPHGKLIIITPNRRSLWAHKSTTPFGKGWSYTMTRLINLGQKCGFERDHHFRCLYYPPFENRLLRSFRHFIEIFGRIFLRKFSGLIGVVFQKPVYGMIAKKHLFFKKTPPQIIADAI